MPAAARVPKSTYLPVPVTDLSGGLDQRKTPTLLKANRSVILQNFSLREPGALPVYPGWRTFSTTNLGSSRPQGGQRVYLGSATPFTLAAWNGGVYKVSDAGAWGAAVSSGWSSTNDIYFPHDRDLVAIFDGATAPKKSVDGTTWTTFGIAAPSVAPTGATAAGGTLVNGNTYEFSFTGRDDGLLVESNESATVQKATTGANQKITLTLTGPLDTQVDTLVVYGRDVTAGEDVRRQIGTVANPGAGLTTTYDVLSNNWTSGVEAPTDHTVPPLLSFGVFWKNRCWARHATVKNRLHFTQIFEPQSWPDDFTIDIPFEHGDDIAAILPLGDTLLVFGQTKIFLIIGQTSLDFEIRPSGASQSGALGARAVDALEEGAMHAAADGIYLFDGATDRLLSYDIDGFTPTAIGWRTYVTTASATDLARTPLIYHQATKEVAIGVTNLYPFGTGGEWILDLNRTRLSTTPAWTTTDRAVGGYIRWDGNETTTGNRGRLFSWSQSIGRLYEERVGTTADGADMVASYEGPMFTSRPRVAQLVDTYVDVEPNIGTFSIEAVVDNSSIGSQAVDISGGGPILGTAILGSAVLGGAGRKQVPLMWDLNDGLTFFVRGTYTGQGDFHWFGYFLGLQPENAPRGII
jgi:hypothetical protein